jgi:hypothetical protein
MRLGRTPVTTQLSRLALAGRTGVLRVPGNHGGTIHLYRGVITSAESWGAPDVGSRLALWSAGLDAGAPSVLARAWVIREAIADGAHAMLAQAPRSARFAEGDVASPDSAATMTVPEMLVEVSRRHEVIRQLPTALTPDTVVARNPRFGARSVHVSAGQWALLARMNEQATPRWLAIDCSTSVFATTLQVFRLITIGLVAVVGGPPPDQRAISFIRATVA